MSEQAVATRVGSSECCASVLAAPLEAGDAAELAVGFSARPTRSASGCSASCGIARGRGLRL